MEVCIDCGKNTKNHVREELIDKFKQKHECVSDKLNVNGRELKFPVMGRVQITNVCSNCDLNVLIGIEKYY